MLMTVVWKRVITLNDERLANASFAIKNGKFNTKGIIYGTTTLTAQGLDTDSTLTGLIGTKGAVAIFASGDNTGFQHVGGFVASHDCTAAAGNPFHAVCTDNVEEQRTFVNDCNDNSLKDGCDESITGVDGGLTVNQCIETPYNFECGGRDGAFSAVRSVLDAVCAFKKGTNPFDNRCDGHPTKDISQQYFCGESHVRPMAHKSRLIVMCL